MFKYVKFNKVETEYTVLQFNGNPVDEDIQVFQFDVSVVSIKCEDVAKIDALIASQDTRIDCKVIDKAEFKELASNSAQINRCRTMCKEHMAKKYDLADELSMVNRDSNDVKATKYKAYREECLAICNGLKAEVGY